ncbi:anti-sigma factor family protein [Streptacidiphilus neutrinimicus]|uniref:anti-sigma factor family protein n=1 Tax=Streptacidiphilus neutrinimicus TaxID=105420 RepID=UPI0005AAAAEB|nr:zf-HC2 domain-containing protein [Streptacidiphilus neutrinimicus]
MTTCRESVQLGAYLLGALDPEERAALEAHISGCADCQAELVAMAPLPGLLRHTPFEELDETAATAQSLPAPHVPPAPDAVPAPPAGTTAADRGWFPEWATGQEPGPGTSRGPRPETASGPEAEPVRPVGHARPRPRRRVLVSAGLALAGAAAAVGVWVYVGGANSTSPTPSSAATTVSAVDARTHVTASAALTPENWGTQVQLKLGNLPQGITCHLVVHARDGRTETAGTWGSGYSTATIVPTSTSIGSSDIATMDVVDGGGTVLVQLPG